MSKPDYLMGYFKVNYEFYDSKYANQNERLKLDQRGELQKDPIFTICSPIDPSLTIQGLHVLVLKKLLNCVKLGGLYE